MDQQRDVAGLCKLCHFWKYDAPKYKFSEEHLKFLTEVCLKSFTLDESNVAGDLVYDEELER